MGVHRRPSARSFPREGNPLWPLPADYGNLSPEFRKLARLNAVRNLNSTEDAVGAWKFFRDYYLAPQTLDDGSTWDSGFFQPPYLPGSWVHYALVRWWYEYDFHVFGLPRGSAKSTWKRIMALWLGLAMAPYDINLFLAKDDFAVEEMFRIKAQLENNERILEDFGQQRHTRGEGMWNNHLVITKLGSMFRTLSFDGKKRGLRGFWNCTDDIDQDDSVAGSKNQIIDRTEEFLKVVVPMLNKGCKFSALGTNISRQSFLYHVYSGDDVRFRDVRQGGDWFKLMLPAVDEHGNYLWGEKLGPEFLEMRRRQMGEAWYAAEYLNDPRSAEAAPFNVIARDHEYVLRDGGGQPPPSAEAGLGADVRVTVSVAKRAPGGGVEYEDSSTDWAKAVQSMRRVICVDYAKGLLSSHDFSAVVVGGLDARNDLYVLDAWQGKVSLAMLGRKVWELIRTWKPMKVGIEAVSLQLEVYNQIKEMGEYYAKEWGVMPSLVPLTWGNVAKEDRIMWLDWRFSGGRIKFPAHLRHTTHMRELYHQILNFTPDGRGLSHDDLIDTLSMVEYMGRKLGKPGDPPVSVELGPLDYLMRGHRFYPGTDIPLGAFVDAASLTDDQLSRIMDSQRPLTLGPDRDLQPEEIQFVVDFS